MYGAETRQLFADISLNVGERRDRRARSRKVTSGDLGGGYCLSVPEAELVLPRYTY